MSKRIENIEFAIAAYRRQIKTVSGYASIAEFVAEREKWIQEAEIKLLQVKFEELSKIK